FGQRRRIRFRAGAGNRARAISFHPLSDSGRRRRFVAYADVLAFPDIARTTEAGALHLLGYRRYVRAQRTHQGTDRARVSDRSNRSLSAADREFATPASAAPGFKRAGIFRNRCALAYSSRP